MKLHYFFVDQELQSGKEVVLEDEELVHQWRNVFRFKSEQQVILLDNSGWEWAAKIVDWGKKSATVAVSEGKKSEAIPKREIVLFTALPKKDNFEWILEKGTELGVSHFVPVVSERVEKKEVNAERCRKIIREAAEQSHHAILPTLHEITKIEAVFEQFPLK